MSEQPGFFYLHTEGALIFKSSMSHSERDLIESPFVRCYWPFNPGKRADCWHVIIEATVAGVNPDRIRVLAELWRCDEIDVDNFAEYLGMKIVDELGYWKVTAPKTFLKRSGEGGSKILAMVALCRNLGWKCSKDRVSFEDLVKGE